MKYILLSFAFIGGMITGFGMLLIFQSFSVPALNLIVSSTPQEQSQGLSGYSSMATSTGMLFPFAQNGSYCFWQKGMEFPLDYIFIDSNYSVISWDSDLATSTYPAQYCSPPNTRYVLETNAGYADVYLKPLDFMSFVYRAVN